MKKIVCIAGTSRPNNYTSRALAIVVDELEKRSARTVALDARRMTLGFPDEPATQDATRLRLEVEQASAVVLATPEYHGSFSAMTKLIIENLGFPSVLSGKPVALLGVAAGRIGAIKALEQLRSVCAHTGAIVLPGAISIAGVRGAFNAEGAPTDPGTEKALRGLATSLLEFIKNYVCPKYALEAMVRGDTPPWSSSV